MSNPATLNGTYLSQIDQANTNHYQKKKTSDKNISKYWLNLKYASNWDTMLILTTLYKVYSIKSCTCEYVFRKSSRYMEVLGNVFSKDPCY